MKMTHVLSYVAPAALFILAWELLVYENQQRQFLFGSPSLILTIAREELIHFSIWNDILLC
jgi:ABC-type nitrate/sulfonate/bicarbonate transport system permease component